MAEREWSMSRIKDVTVAGRRPENAAAADRAPLRDRMPELGSRIVGGLGLLLLSPTVLTAASRSRLTCGSVSDGAKRLSNGSAENQSAQLQSAENQAAPARKVRGDVRMRIAVTASGLAAAGSLAYTVPGAPWANADVLAAPSAADSMTKPEAPIDMDMSHGADTPYSGFIRLSDRTLLVDATPAKVGVNTIAITVLDAKNAPADVDQWSATASLPGGGVPDVPVKLAGFGDGAAAADAQLPVAGQWTLKITVQVAGEKPATYTHVLPIAP
jgi:hypothetical protein